MTWASESPSGGGMSPFEQPQQSKREQASEKRPISDQVTSNPLRLVLSASLMAGTASPPNRSEPLVRWRLVLGDAANDPLGGCGMNSEDMEADSALGWLYDRSEEGDEERDIRDRQGGDGSGAMTV